MNDYANFSIREQAKLNPERHGMGAAIAALHVSGPGFCLAHVGHVRGYRLRDGALQVLSEDHTRLNNYLWKGVPYDVAEKMPDAYTLARALGLSMRVQVTARIDDMQPWDLVALVSNGLYNAMSDQQMARILGGRTPLDAMADHLVSVAQAHHAPDDVSCVLLRWIAASESGGGRRREDEEREGEEARALHDAPESTTAGRRHAAKVEPSRARPPPG